MLGITKHNFIATVLFVIIFSCAALAQTSEFSYQGKLNDTAAPANGVYDLSFKLYNSSGSPIGSVITKNDVQVTDGVFSVSLDFGAASFDGSQRFLEIAVRAGASTGGYTTLAPMQPVTSSPYAVRSLSATTADTATNATTATTATNATQLGGMAASQFVQTGDPRMTDAREPLPNSASYIQNSTNTQTSSNFNVSGNGTAGGTLSGNAVNSATQYNIAGSRVFWAGNTSVFAGVSAGPVDVASPGGNNTYVGFSAGAPSGNSSFNTFIGNQTGINNTASQNTFVGHSAGIRNFGGMQNSFFGTRAGGSANAGAPAITGNQNSLFGYKTGWNLAGGNGNTLIGYGADVGPGSPNVINGTAIGAGAIVSQNDSVILGNGARVGIGTSAPQYRLQVVDFGNTGLRVQNQVVGGTVGSFGAAGDFNIDSTFAAGGRLNIKEDGTVTVGGPTRFSSPVVMSVCPDCFLGQSDRLIVDGTARITMASAGSSAVCRNASQQLALCSSSLRYKTGIESYRPGLDLIMKLQPISFRWKSDDMLDLGLGAEKVAVVEPLLVTHNDSGEIEGVKYDRVAVVLVNAVKEQQAQIEKQQELISQQQRQIDGLRRSVASLRKRRGR